MERIIQAMTEKHRQPALDFVERVFTEHKDAQEGRTVRRLVEEIRQKRWYEPRLEFTMTDETGEIIGYCMFSRFPIEGRYEDELLILTPVAVKTALQRQHISRDLIEHGFACARALGYRAVLVEGAPWNYHPRGFDTSSKYGIVAGPNLRLPHEDCLMAAALVPGGLDRIHGAVDYGMYDVLSKE